MIKLALLGATGRMGTRVLNLLADDPRFQVVAALTRSNDSRLGDRIQVGAATVTMADETRTPFDVLLDFSVPQGTMRWLEHCQRGGSAMVIGATGHSDEQLDRITATAGRIAILKASNFSIGINLLLALAGDVGRRLGDDFDIEIIEHHHSQKIDAPSGTAIALTDAIVEATGRDRENDVIYGRQGQAGRRPPRQIGLHAVRMGSLVGRHEIHYSSSDETVTLLHTAHSRDAFARGALQAAAWIASRPPNMYTMRDVP